MKNVFLKHALKETRRDLERGICLVNLAGRLAGIGKYRKALSAARRAVQFQREHAKADPNTFNRYLALSLTSLAEREADCGFHRSALTTAKKAVALCGKLLRDKPIERAADLARALMTLADRHSTIGETEESLRIRRVAAKIYHMLAKKDAKYEKDYAAGLFDLTVVLTELGRQEEALEPGEKAVRLFQRLEANKPDAFRPITTAALHTLLGNLIACGQPHRAFDCAGQAVARFQELSQRYPRRFLGDLVTALNNFAACQAALRRPLDALESTRQAVVKAEALRCQLRELGTEYLARTLINLSHCCMLVGQNPEACKVAARSVRLCRQMVRKRPELEHALVSALVRWSEALRLSKVRTRALKVAHEAVALARPMARKNLLAFGSVLAAALAVLSDCVARTGDHKAGIGYASERVRISRRLCQFSAIVHGDKLAFALANLAARLLQAGRTDDALKTVQPALDIYDKLPVRVLDLHRRELATTFEVAAQIHAAQGDRQTAAEFTNKAKLIAKQAEETEYT